MRPAMTPKPTVPDVLPLVHAYYAKPGNSVGGNLHLVLEDANVDDRHVAFCLKVAEDAHDDDGAAIARLLLRMSRTQRIRIAANLP